MSQWIEIGAENEFEPGSHKCVRAENNMLLVIRTEDEFRVVDNSCPHAGMPLDQGYVEGKVLTCPFHGYAYNIDTGKNVDFEGDVPLTTYPVKIENGNLMVEIP